MVASPLVVPAWAHHPAVFAALQIALLGFGYGRLVPRMPLVDWIAKRIPRYEGLLVLPVVVVRAAQKDADAKIDVDQTGGDQLAVDNDTGRDEHRPAPLLHVLIAVVAHVRVLERAPAAEQDSPSAHFFIAGQSLVEEVEDVVVERDRLLDEVQEPDQADHVIGE